MAKINDPIMMLKLRINFVTFPNVCLSVTIIIKTKVKNAYALMPKKVARVTKKFVLVSNESPSFNRSNIGVPVKKFPSPLMGSSLRIKNNVNDPYSHAETPFLMLQYYSIPASCR